ncbi:MAG: MerR family transcriptional regulator [Gammaproteobacteria bacterium]
MITLNSYKDDKEYSIGAVAKLTGLTDHTIRAWERRHGAVTTLRAPNGRRVYGPEQVEKLGLLKTLTDQGVSIGQIADENVASLRDRARALSLLATTPLPDVIEVAVLGDFVPGQLSACRSDLAPLEIRISEASRERFSADTQRHKIDVVIVETPVLDTKLLSYMRDTIRKAGAACGVLIYNYGRLPDVDLAIDSRLVVMRSPVTADEVRAAVLRAYTPRTKPDNQPKESKPEDIGWEDVGQVAPRQFSTQQLATLTRASTAIDCECPHHLAQLVSDLNAFELYSANCENRDEDDAALHRYLHQTTAEARALIEVALERVARAEGINY